MLLLGATNAFPTMTDPVELAVGAAVERWPAPMINELEDDLGESCPEVTAGCSYDGSGLEVPQELAACMEYGRSSSLDVMDSCRPHARGHVCESRDLLSAHKASLCRA
jgi:hypothetical protein